MADGAVNRTTLRHAARRPPRKANGFSWGRFPVEEGRAVSWRLFRRDLAGKLHTYHLDFAEHVSRAQIADRVWRARIALRDRVDDIVLQQLGVSP